MSVRIHKLFAKSLILVFRCYFFNLIVFFLSRVQFMDKFFPLLSKQFTHYGVNPTTGIMSLFCLCRETIFNFQSLLFYEFHSLSLWLFDYFPTSETLLTGRDPKFYVCDAATHRKQFVLLNTVLWNFALLISSKSLTQCQLREFFRPQSCHFPMLWH